MSNSTAVVLMKKGKRGAAAYIHADCASGSPQHLGPLLDVLLNPSKTLDDWETLDWCRWLIAGGRTPDEFATIVRSYDKHDKCGLVWIPRVVAYRCRTCGISPCMSICRECFHRGDHSTHDFNMFLSQAGGACDCGDNSVMKEDGFCNNHRNKDRPGTAPAELKYVAEAMMPRLILRLLQHFRENSCGTSAPNSDRYRIAVAECEHYVQMLMEFNKMGDLMRSAMTKALINPQMYRNLVEPPFPDTDYGRYMTESNKMYEQAINSFPAPTPPDEYKHLPALAPRLTHSTLLEEFIFWTFMYEFPQNVVCFLLNMLPDQDYKEHLTRTFVMHYARIPLVLESAADPDTLSNRVVHMSVQLFSNEALALRCVQQLHLLHVMVLSLRLMMGKILVQNTLHDPDKNMHFIIDCTKRVMKEHCYWPLVSDFNNVLSHKSVALLFLQDDALVDMWFEFLSMLQGMNVNIRETGSHIEFEPSSYYAAFSCELEAAAYPMWSVLAHLTEPQHASLARRVIAAALTHLQEWLEAVGYTGQRIGDTQHASFHFPLHRYLAAFICAGARCLNLPPEEVLPPPDLLALLAAHPLRVQALYYEILAGIWVRNGLQIKGQAMTYIQANFCNSMVDIDIYWLQVCAAHLPPDDFINMCIDAFGCREWLSMVPLPPVQAAEQEAMVEGLLTFLAILVSSRTNISNDELTQSRLEVSTLLAAGDKTHSQLLELMPERSGNAHTRNFENVLKELSTYRAPPRGSETLEQGLFVPRAGVWLHHYEPLHVLRRAVHRRDYHTSMERFTAAVRTAGLAPSTTGSLWPPLRAPPAPPPPAPDPRPLATSGVLSGAILSVLHRCVSRGACSGSAELCAALCVLLLRTAAALHVPQPLAIALHGPPPAAAGPLLTALTGRSLPDLVCSTVTSVTLPAARTQAHQQPPARYTPDSDTDWEPEQSEVSRLQVQSTAIAVPQPMQVARTDDENDMEISEASGDAPRIRRALEPLTSAELELLNAESYEMSPEPWGPSISDQDETPALPAPSHHSQVSQIVCVTQLQVQESQPQTVMVNESIISLLLKLHSQLSGRPDSFVLEEEPTNNSEIIGDGPHFISLALRQLAALDTRVSTCVSWCRRRVHTPAAAPPGREARAARARARQAQLLADFRQQQRAFMAAARDNMEWEACAGEGDACVICGVGTDEPTGLVVLLQGSSVAGHRGPASEPTCALPLDAAGRARLSAARTRRLHAHAERLLEELRAAGGGGGEAGAGRDGGVHAHTCGHTLHLRCLHAYLRSLASPQRPHNLHVDRGEFLCPVCRQLANSVLPLSPPPPPAPPRASLAPPPTPAVLGAELQAMLDQEPAPPTASPLSEAMGKAMEDMTGLASLKLRQRYGASPGGIFTFVGSLCRYALECEVIQLGGSVVGGSTGSRYARRGAALAPLLEVCAAHARALAVREPALRSSVARAWAALGAPVVGEEDVRGDRGEWQVVVGSGSETVPLLLTDAGSLLIHSLLLVGERVAALDVLHFRCLVARTHALTYAQTVGSVLAALGAGGRVRAAQGEGGAARTARELLRQLEPSCLFGEDGGDGDAAGAGVGGDDVTAQVETLCLPFLRIAALLQHHLYGLALPMGDGDEYTLLTQYMELPKAPEPDAAVSSWGRALGLMADRGRQLAVRRILTSLHIEWRSPALLALPKDYDELFTYYHERVCTQCGAVPKEASLCLLCGALVCLKQACCRRLQVCEAVFHANECGGGTGIFLVVTSTYIIVIRGRRACLWGSLYLDDYDEEDRDLKRGKPLYLSEDRFQLLQDQWLAHRFDHTKRTWVWHRDSL